MNSPEKNNQQLSAMERFNLSISNSISDHEFGLYQKLIYEKSGIWLSEVKKALLVGRLARRLRILGIPSYAEYYNYVLKERDPLEMTHMLDCICTNETQFFREPQQFEYIQRKIIPEWEAMEACGRRSRVIKIWSAGCSTGEEPYSIAMLLLDAFGKEAKFEFEVFATDLSSKALETARKGVWPIEKARNIPEKLLKSYMLKGVDSEEGKMAAGSELRSVLKFRQLNLNDDSYAINNYFDIIFCRNVLIYFDFASKSRVIERLISHLAPSGYLFVGHSENLGPQAGPACRIAPNSYKLIRDGK